MRVTKDFYFQQLEQADIAGELAVETGFLNRCEYHPTFVWQNDWDLNPLYRIAAWRFKRGEVGGPFYAQRELTDAFKAVMEDAPIECPRCDYESDQ
jgi:hypothetical protein